MSQSDPRGAPKNASGEAESESHVTQADAALGTSPLEPDLLPPNPTAVAASAEVPAGAEATPASSPLTRFFTRLLTLERGQGESVRVLWLGDSHTAADFMTGRIRTLFQDRFGDGGPGFVPFGLSGARHESVLSKTVGRWRHEPPSPASSLRQLDGVFGLSGQRAVTSDASATAELRARVRLGSATLRWQLVMRLVGASAAVSVDVDGQLQRLPEDGAGRGKLRVRGSQLQSFDVDVPSNAKLVLRSPRGRVELFGAVAETPEAGFVLDSVGINGARASTPLGWHRGSWLGEVAERNPALVVFSYGTNEASDATPLDRYAKAYRELLEEIRSVTDGADCLLVGPTARGDEKAMPRVPSIDEFQSRLARELGCDYFSLMQAMGGALGFDAWRNERPALAAKDGVHLTRAGYDRLAESFARHLLGGYGSWRASSRP